LLLLGCGSAASSTEGNLEEQACRTVGILPAPDSSCVAPDAPGIGATVTTCKPTLEELEAALEVLCAEEPAGGAGGKPSGYGSSNEGGKAEAMGGAGGGCHTGSVECAPGVCGAFSVDGCTDVDCGCGDGSGDWSCVEGACSCAELVDVVCVGGTARACGDDPLEVDVPAGCTWTGELSPGGVSVWCCP
jgi:hypothetical protein